MKICSTVCRAALILNGVKGIGPAKLKKMLSGGLSDCSPGELARLLYQETGKPADGFLGEIETAKSAAEHQIELAGNCGVRILCSCDPEYPSLLKHSKFDQFLLYVKGNLPASSRSAAVIGSREPPAKADVVAARITAELTERKFSIVSGLALGCDTFAHREALRCHGHTVAVLAHGLDYVYPEENAGLAEQIVAEGGALVSQFPMGEKPAQYNYPKRDKIQAGLSQLVVMIASTREGGSLIASKSILEDGRDLFVPVACGPEKNSPAFEANRILASENHNEIRKLLKIEGYDRWSHLHILKSREDYVKFEPAAGGSPADEPGMNEQGSLF